MKLAYVMFKIPSERDVRVLWAPNRRLAMIRYDSLRARLGPKSVNAPVDWYTKTKPGTFPNKDEVVDWLNKTCGKVKV